MGRHYAVILSPSCFYRYPFLPEFICLLLRMLHAKEDRLIIHPVVVGGSYQAPYNVLFSTHITSALLCLPYLEMV